jgi:hypothetical protein
MTTEAPILIFFTTNYMGTGYVATPSTRAVNGGVIREKPEESAGHPPAMRRPAAKPDAKRLHNDVARTSSAAFPSVSRGRFLAAKIGVSAGRCPARTLRPFCTGYESPGQGQCRTPTGMICNREDFVLAEESALAFAPTACPVGYGTIHGCRRDPATESGVSQVCPDGSLMLSLLKRSAASEQSALVQASAGVVDG